LFAKKVINNEWQSVAAKTSPAVTARLFFKKTIRQRIYIKGYGKKKNHRIELYQEPIRDYHQGVLRFV
jgi:hypothetical protein